MTETSFTWRWLFVVGAIGIVIGVVAGLLVGWVIAPAAGSAVDVSALNVGAQNDYIIMVSNSYAYDQDLPRARARLALLKDADIAGRVEKLAKALQTRQDPNAPAVADLAVALGSKESTLRVLAASVVVKPRGQPTKFAMVEILPTATRLPTSAVTSVPTSAPTNAPSQTPTLTPTLANTKAPATAGPTRTPRPAATAAPTNPPAPAAAVFPEFRPDFPGLWWNAVRFVPANVASGQQYWHLKSALYCDFEDDRNNCPGLPGGGNGHDIYATVFDSSGGCTHANLHHAINTGQVLPMELKAMPYPWNACTWDYEWNMYGEGNDISVEGLPSDTITNLCLCSVKINWSSRAHVRYYLTFQQTTR